MPSSLDLGPLKPSTEKTSMTGHPLAGFLWEIRLRENGWKKNPAGLLCGQNREKNDLEEPTPLIDQVWFFAKITPTDTDAKSNVKHLERSKVSGATS